MMDNQITIKTIAIILSSSTMHILLEDLTNNHILESHYKMQHTIILDLANFT